MYNLRQQQMISDWNASTKTFSALRGAVFCLGERESDIDSSITKYNIMPWCCVFECNESGENDGTIHMHRFPSKRSQL